MILYCYVIDEVKLKVHIHVSWSTNLEIYAELSLIMFQYNDLHAAFNPILRLFWLSNDTINSLFHVPLNLNIMIKTSSKIKQCFYPS